MPGVMVVVNRREGARKQTQGWRSVCVCGGNLGPPGSGFSPRVTAKKRKGNTERPWTARHGKSIPRSPDPFSYSLCGSLNTTSHKLRGHKGAG